MPGVSGDGAARRSRRPGLTANLPNCGECLMRSGARRMSSIVPRRPRSDRVAPAPAWPRRWRRFSAAIAVTHPAHRGAHCTPGRAERSWSGARDPAGDFMLSCRTAPWSRCSAPSSPSALATVVGRRARSAARPCLPKRRRGRGVGRRRCGTVRRWRRLCPAKKRRPAALVPSPRPRRLRALFCVDDRGGAVSRRVRVGGAVSLRQLARRARRPWRPRPDRGLGRSVDPAWPPRSGAE